MAVVQWVVVLDKEKRRRLSAAPVGMRDGGDGNAEYDDKMHEQYGVARASSRYVAVGAAVRAAGETRAYVV